MSQSIIILEDESIIALMLKKYLQSLNYNVIGIAMDGKSAIKFVQNAAPDLLVFDLQIKGDINGLETYEIIKKDYDIPVVFLTGNSEQIKNIKNRYPNIIVLEKPVSLNELKKSIENTLL